MSKWVTVLTVGLPQQMWVIRTRLESEGIECFAKDELTVQSDNLYSNAIGGVKLQVREEDVPHAIEILKEGGYLKDEPIKPDLLTRLDKLTSSLPFLNRTTVTYRVVIITILLVTLITVGAYFLLKPSTAELLMRGAWCVNRIDYKGKTVGPKTKEGQISIKVTDMNGNNDCEERMEFSQSNSLILPSINTSAINCYWKEDDDGNIVIRPDTLKDILGGTYTVNLSGNNLRLNSKTTTIYASWDSFTFATPFDKLNRRR